MSQLIEHIGRVPIAGSQAVQLPRHRFEDLDLYSRVDLADAWAIIGP